MKVYGLKNCDTCRKAMKALQSAGHEPQFVDVRADGIEKSDLVRFQQSFGSSLVNTRSTTWRGLSESQHESDPIQLLLEFPALMKRPVIETEQGLSLGWSKDVQDKFS